MFKTKSQKIFLVFFTFSFSFFSCDTKKKKTDELAHLVENLRAVNKTRQQMKQMTSFIPSETANRVDFTDITKAKNMAASEGDKLAESAVNSVGNKTFEDSLSEEEREEIKRTSPAASRKGIVTAVSPPVAMSTVIAATNIASALGEDTSSIPMSSLGGLGSFGLSGFDLVTLSCKEFLESFDAQIDEATAKVFKKKEQETYDLDDLIEMREAVLKKAWNSLFASLDKGSDGLSKEEIKNFLVSKTPLSICETQSGFSKLMTTRAELILEEFSSDGKKLTKKEFMKLARTLQRLHDKIVTDLFSEK